MATVAGVAAVAVEVGAVAALRKNKKKTVQQGRNNESSQVRPVAELYNSCEKHTQIIRFIPQFIGFCTLFTQHNKTQEPRNRGGYHKKCGVPERLVWDLFTKTRPRNVRNN